MVLKTERFKHMVAASSTTIIAWWLDKFLVKTRTPGCMKPSSPETITHNAEHGIHPFPREEG